MSRRLLPLLVLVVATTALSAPSTPAAGTDAAVTWEWRRSLAAEGLRWSAVATSADGLVAIAGLDFPQASALELIITHDGGDTWATLSGSPVALWHNIAMSDNGSVVAMTGTVSAQSRLWVSTNSGVSFTQVLAATGTRYGRLAMSADGTKILVRSSTGVWLSTTSADSFTLVTEARSSSNALDVDGDVAMTADGSTMYAATKFGPAYRSIDGGTTWGVLDAAGVGWWTSFDVSGDGSTALGLLSNDPPLSARLSTNSGATFIEAPGVASRFELQQAVGGVSRNGRVLIAATYATTSSISTDGGATWGSSGPSLGWTDFAVSADGSQVYGAVESGAYGGVWIATPAAPTITGLSPSSLPNTGGETLTITGTNFVGVTGVTVAGTSLAFTVVSPSQIQVTTPALSTELATVTVATRSGSTSATAPVQFSLVIDVESTVASTTPTTAVPAVTTVPVTSVPGPVATPPSTVAVNEAAPAVVPPMAAQIAATPPTDLGVLPSTVSPGATFEVSLGGFTPGEWVYVYVASEPILVGAARADSTGTVRLAIDIPLLSGQHSLVFHEPATGLIRRQAITVQAIALPSTGQHDTAVWIAVALLLAGALTISVTARRSRACAP